MNKQQNAKIASTYGHYANKVWNPVEWYKDYTGQNKPEKDDHLTGIGRAGVGLLLTALTGGAGAKMLGIPLSTKLGIPGIGKLISALRVGKSTGAAPGKTVVYNTPQKLLSGPPQKLLSGPTQKLLSGPPQKLLSGPTQKLLPGPGATTSSARGATTLSRVTPQTGNRIITSPRSGYKIQSQNPLPA